MAGSLLLAGLLYHCSKPLQHASLAIVINN